MKPRSYRMFAPSQQRPVTSRLRTPFFLAGTVAALFAGRYDAAGASFTWNNGTGNWSGNTQWIGAVTPPSGDNTTRLTFGGSGVIGYTSTVDTGGGASDPWVVNGITLNSAASVAETVDNTNTGGIRFLGTIPFLNQLGSGAFNISAPLSLGTGIPVLTLGGSGTGLVTIGGIISPQSGTIGLTKTGSSSFTLTGANTYNGATTLQRGTLTLSGTNGAIASSSGITLGGRSTLTLNNTSAANNGDRVAGTFASTAGGGTFNFVNDAAAATNYSETIGAVTTGTGTLNINTSQAASGQTSILTLASLARTAGGTLRLSGDGSGVDDRNRISVTTAPTLTANILPYVILIDPTSTGTGIVNFATSSGAGAALTKYTGYQTGAETNWSANTVNARPAADQTITAARTLNSLVLDDTVDLLAGTQDRTITMGQSGVGAVVQTGGASNMLASGTSEIVLAFGTSEAIFNIEGTLIHERNGTTVLTGTGGLTKTGPGNLILRGDGVGSTRYGLSLTGPLNLNQGLFDISSDGSGVTGFTAINFNGGDYTFRNTSGSGNRAFATTNIVVNADGTLSEGVVAAAAVSGTLSFNTLAINNGATLAFAAGPNANVGSTPKLSIAGATTLNSDGTINTGTGATVTLVGAVGQDASSRSLTKDGAGTLVLSAAGTYTGGTTIKSGILSFVTDGIGTSGNVTFTGGTLQHAASNTQDLSSRLHNSTGAISIDIGANAVTYASAIDSTNTGGLSKLGSGTLTLSGANTYSGGTTVTAGTLAITGSGSINSTSGVTIASAATFRYNSSVAYAGGPITNNGGTITGTGPIGVPVALVSLTDKLAPGNSPGTQQYTVPQSWNSFTYQWETSDFTGATGGTHFDQIGITGVLDLTGGSNAYALDLISLTALNLPGDAPNFSEIDRSWTILTTTGGISGFTASNWTINTAGFSNTEAGTWSLALGNSNNDLVLSYAAVPEPRAALLGGIALLALLRRRRNA